MDTKWSLRVFAMMVWLGTSAFREVEELFGGSALLRVFQRVVGEVALEINQSINQSYTVLSPMLEVAGIIF